MGSCLSSNCRCYCNNNRRRRSNSSQNSRQNRTNSLSNNFSSISINDLQQTQHASSSSNRLTNESSNFMNLVINDSITLNPVPTGRNKRLKKDKWKWKSDVSLTEDELEAKRDEFWDTQPAFGGRVEIWNALKAICNAIDTNQNYELAQAIIDSAQIILPNGTLNDCYDELGNHYQLPNYVIIKPINLKKLKIPSTSNNSNNKVLNNNTITPSDNTDNKSNSNNIPTTDTLNVTSDTTTTTTSPPPPPPTTTAPTTTPNTTTGTSDKQELQLKFRLSNNLNSSDLKLVINLNQSIIDIKKKIHELKQIEPIRQRMYFGGKLLADRVKMKDLKLEKNFVIQVIVREDQQQTS